MIEGVKFRVPGPDLRRHLTSLAARLEREANEREAYLLRPDKAQERSEQMRVVLENRVARTRDKMDALRRLADYVDVEDHYIVSLADLSRLRMIPEGDLFG